MNFTPINQNGLYEGFALITKSEKKVTAKGKDYLDLTLSDKDGEISAKYWDYNEAVQGQFPAETLVKVRGTISQYNGADQFRVERIRKATDADDVNMADFVRSASYSGEYMYAQLSECVNGFADADFKKLVSYMLEQNKEKLLYWPAAYRLHHALRGGLLMHTLSIVRLCEGVCKVYPFVNRDLLLSGAILHDIAKLSEFVVGDTGIASGYSVEGNLIGHLVMGARMVDEAAKALAIPAEKSVLLQHMVLSHHGEPDFGAAVRPLFLEAELLSELDLMDARVYQIHDATTPLQKGAFTNRLWALEDRKMYNHGLSDNDKQVQL
ncbi:MAG: HD domain-containing protein [Clostridia bacterium]|nr:HD domain-containing protein [Clostridia bacterium]